MRQFVRSELWVSAFNVARRKIAAGEDYLYWQTQLAAAMFLDERDYATQYQCLPLLSSLRTDFPGDYFVAYLRGYCTFMLTQRTPQSDSDLHYATGSDEVKPYALIALLAYDEAPQTIIDTFEEVIRLHPSNIWAHLRLGQRLVADGQMVQARAHLEAAASTREPYIERGFGVLSDYLNIFTGGLHPGPVRVEAERMLAEMRPSN